MKLVPIVIGLMVLETACATAQDAVRTFSMDTIRERCIAFAEVSRGSGTDGYRDCRVSRFGELGTVDGETYYYAIYCLIPAASPVDSGSCGDDSFAQYHRARGLAVFARATAATDVRLVFERVSGDLGMYVYPAGDKGQTIRAGVRHLRTKSLMVAGATVSM
jgi:hypothetical protein